MNPVHQFQHRLGTSVLTLIILPLAFSCESGHNKTQIIEDYRNVIQKQLKHVEASIEQLYSNCTIRNVSKSKEPRNFSVNLVCKCYDLPFSLIPELVNVKFKAQHNIHRKLCRVNGKLRRYESEPDNVNGQLKDVLYKLVEEIDVSLRCWCQLKRKRQMQQIRKWKPCKVKDILVNLQGYFEQYNAYHSLGT